MDILSEKLHYIPVILVWLETILFILVYGFTLLNTNPLSSINDPFQSFGVIILLITTGGASVTLFLTARAIDQNPINTKRFLVGSVLTNSLAMFLSVFSLLLNFLIIPGMILLGLSLATLAVSSMSYFTVNCDINRRGIEYSVTVFISILLSLLITVTVETLKLAFWFPLILLAIISLLASIILYFALQKRSIWVNDQYPTSFNKIISRKPVQAYFTSHFFIYLMLGVSFVTISGFIDNEKLFWVLVLIGDLLAIIPMGKLSDKVGRKDLIVVGIYVIVLSILLVALTKDPRMYYVSAFVLGISFSMMHTSIDNNVWADLSPLDSIGRYSALNILSLLQGLGTGFIVGFVIISLGKIDVTAYILIALAAIGMLPMFFVADSYDPLNLYLLLVSTSGLLIFHYDFKKEESISQKDLTLVSGALSALDTIFENLYVESKGHGLDLVRHGDVFVVQAKSNTTSGLTIHGTIFANKMDPELHDKVTDFINRFTKRFNKELEAWTGLTTTFSSAIEDAEDIFGPLIPSQTK